MNAIRPFSCLTIAIIVFVLSFSIAPAQSVPGLKYTLYSPGDFAAEGIECTVYLHWQKPLQPGGVVPPGLLGYNIYRDGVLIHFNPDPDLLSYYDYDVEWGTYSYAVTAYYDLSSYGFPGEFEESVPAGPVIVSLSCDVSLPFLEPWDMGIFSFQSWKFFPAQGNWFMDTGQGNPLPAAGFRGNPALTNYNFLMQGLKLDGRAWVCATFFLEFDLKLMDSMATGTETLSVECYYDSTWHSIASFANNGSTGWMHHKIEVPELSGSVFRIGFRVAGLHSANIKCWYVDNIKVYGQCFAPTACSINRLLNEVILTWQPPLCDSLTWITGYNVYRSQNVLEPFEKLNASYITDFVYHDVLPGGFPHSKLWYFITDVQRSPVTGEVLCEAACDTLEIDLTLGNDPFTHIRPVITASFHEGNLLIRSDIPVDSYVLYDLTGMRVGSADIGGISEFTIPSHPYSTGVYLLQMITRDRTFSLKVLVNK